MKFLIAYSISVVIALIFEVIANKRISKKIGRTQRITTNGYILCFCPVVNVVSIFLNLFIICTRDSAFDEALSNTIEYYEKENENTKEE